MDFLTSFPERTHSFVDTENIVLITKLSSASSFDPDWVPEDVEPFPRGGDRLYLLGGMTPPES